MELQLALPGIVPPPTHTETALRVHDLWADESGAYLTIAAVWTGRFRTVGDACQFAEKVRAHV